MTIRERFSQMMTPTHPTDHVRPAYPQAPTPPAGLVQPGFSRVRERQRHSFALFRGDDDNGDDDESNNGDDDESNNGETTPSMHHHPSINGSPSDYYIVLVDIRKTIEKRRIECVKKLLVEPGLRYCAISYRWGEVPEQAIVTPDYIAHVTSFSISDLERLCGQILVSNDFTENGEKKPIDYLWVDAISIDQQNEKARKATIRQMNQIYHHSTMILAVPDLHLSYLKQTPSTKSTLARVRKHTPQIYHHATGACQPHKQLHRRINRPSAAPVQQPSPHHQTYEFPHVATHIRPSPSSSVTTLETSSSSSSLLTPITPLTPDDSPIQEQKPQPFKTSQCECYQDGSNGVDKYCIAAIKLLDYLVMEWSNRAWVISEYHIGRVKTMRLWFLSFDHQWFYTSRPRFIPLFDCFYRDHFRHRKFLDMMLNSRVTKNEDRFYAILPLSIHYKHHIQTQDTVSQWQISDMTSVCMRLYEFVGLLEKIAMLFCCSKGPMLILPSFASCFNNGNGNNGISKILDLDPRRLLVQSITLMAPISQETEKEDEATRYYGYKFLHRHDHPHQSHRDRSFIKVKTTCHRFLSTTINRDTRMFWDRNPDICHQLEWKFTHHHQKNHLDQVFLPFIESKAHTPIGIHLVGDRSVNRWIVYQLTMINVNVPASEWKLINQVEEFNIY